MKTMETGNRLGKAEDAKVCFHSTIVDLECTSCGAEFNKQAFAEVLERWERKNLRLTL
jgi:hypothetical protein